MLIELCKSKIGNAFITGKNLHYKGSITISSDIAKRAQLYPAEKVLVINVNNGERFETYVIIGEEGKGTIELNGGAARKGEIGDELIVLSFAMYDEKEAKSQKMMFLQLKDSNRLPDANS